MNTNELEIQELPSKNLESLGVDWTKFRQECISYYNRWSHIEDEEVYLTTTDESLPDNEQITRKGSNAFFINRIDPFVDYSIIQKFIEQGNHAYVADQKFKHFTNDLKINHPYVIDVIKRVEDFVELKFTKIRLSCIKGPSCWAVHTDFGLARYHIPIVTNSSCYYQIGNQLYCASKYDHFYTLPSTIPHNLINSSFRKRINLLLIDEKSEFDSSLSNISNLIKNSRKRVTQAFEELDPIDYELNKNYFDKIKNTLPNSK